MARIRTIKPEFWGSESIGRLSRDARLLFIGLWNQADDHGRFRAHPRLLASSVFPYDDDALKCINIWLAELVHGDCVRLYKSGRDQFGYIPAWQDLQRVEKPSPTKFPEPPPFQPPEKTERPRDSGSIPGGVGEESGKPPKLSCREQGTGNREQGKEEKHTSSGDDPVLLKTLWNENAHPTLPRCKELSGARKSKAVARLRDRPIDQWLEVIKRINASPFCRGETGTWRGATFDWLLKPDTATKVLEGAYDNVAPIRAAKGRASEAEKDWTNYEIVPGSF